ncbi:Fanconi anemia group M protein-like [Dendronephthya gigantea]|uniref:Fanconi anemia group M protein-like n=1 Tax=Dendronephthya gigantea TaxID=151771 RepID=UPI00106D3DFF|nr:Fanconi anemia group M protein-like [Dendronephthya gigantea]
MKKTNNHLSGQKTLFQTWNKQNRKKTQTSSSLFQTWGPNRSTSVVRHEKCDTGSLNYLSGANKNTSTSIVHQRKPDTESLKDLLNIDDEDNDNEFLAAIDQIEQCENAKSSNDVGNLSFSAAANDDVSDVIPGFDCNAGDTWIYPTNYPLRDYQFNIVEKALFHNTLVTLPTGLGKTFIAAVVMYNFYRWYPQGKIIFMAPTKPLVAQQIEACYNIMGIPPQDTAEMTGSMTPAKREILWKEKRVFFLTPQVFQNDLGRGSCRADDVACLVFDEAHKALGNYSYCQVVREVLGYTQNFRILALSATPGDGIKAVQQVITNLLVSHIELRSEDSADIKPYTHERQVEKIVVQLGDELGFFKTKFLRVLRIVVNRLSGHQVLWMRDAERVSKCLLLAAREQFRKKCAEGQQSRQQIGPIEGDFAVAISLYHGYDLLMQHGLLPFYNFIKGIVDGSKGGSRAKTELARNPDFIGIVDDLRNQIEPPHSNGERNGSNVNPSFIGHPKLVKLRDIVLEHFRACDGAQHSGNTKGSRVMIFSQYRDSVQEISRMLSLYKPLVKVMSFIGQQSKGNASKGLTQKEQLEVIRKFRDGGYNTLAATCVGEEGLDIGEVDLIVCFDASASPIRLVQRMGRTGRKRDGRIIVLVTEGKEEQIYQRSQRNKSNIHKTILESARTLDLYMENPRMVPRNIKPVCQKMFITVAPKPTKNKSKPTRKSAEGNIKKLFSVCARKENGFLSPEELRYWNDNFKLPNHDAGLTPSKAIHVRSRGSIQPRTEPTLSLTEWTAWQTPLQQVHYVDHSKRSRNFAEILEFCDFRRDCGDDDDSYDLEMLSFLNREDVPQPGEKKADYACATGNGEKDGNQGRRKKVIVLDDEEEGSVVANIARKKGCLSKSTGFSMDSDEEITNVVGINECGDKMTKKDGKSSRKRKSLDFGSDIDDDFECETNVSTKAVNTVQNELCDVPSLEQEPQENSPKKKQLEPGEMTENHSGSHRLSVNGKLVSDKTPNTSRSEHSVDSDGYLSGFDIPSSQRQRKNTRASERRNSEARISEDHISEVVPDAPSLDTLLDLSTCIAEGNQEYRSNLEEEESDRDFFPVMFAETHETSKNKTCDNGRKHVVEFGKDDLSRLLFSDEVGNNEQFGIKEADFNKRRSPMDSENNEKETMLTNKYENSSSIRKTVDRFQRPDLPPQESTPSRNTEKCNRDIGNKGYDGDDFYLEKKVISKEKTSRKQMLESKDFDEELLNSLFEDDLDRVVCDVKTPCVFDDEQETLQMKKKRMSKDRVVCDVKTLCVFDDEQETLQKKKKRMSKNRVVCDVKTPFVFDDEQETLQMKKKRMSKDRVVCDVKTPCVFDDEQETLQRKKKRMSKEMSTIERSENGNLNSGSKAARTLFDEDDIENRRTEEEITKGKSENLPSRSLRDYSCTGLSFDNTSLPQRQPLVEQKRNSNMSSWSRVNERSLDKIRSFCFSKSATSDQSLSLKTTMSKPHVPNSPEEYGPDVVAPSPLRVNRKSCFGKSFLMKSVCSEKDGEMRTSQCKRRMLKLKSKKTSMENRSSEAVQIGGAALIKEPRFQSNSLSTQAGNTDKDIAQKGSSSSLEASVSLNKNKLSATKNDCSPKKVKERISYDEIKNDKYSAFATKSSPVARISLPGRTQNKVESHHVKLCTSSAKELADGEIDHTGICVNATRKSSREKSVCYEENQEHAKKVSNKNLLFKKPSNPERRSPGECGDQFGESRENSEESVEASPLVKRRKGKFRSKVLKSRILGSDDECGVEFSDSDGEYGEDVGPSSLGDQTKQIHQIPDSDDEFDLQENLNVKRKRKLSVHRQSKDNKSKKRRPQVDDFLDDEAEVTEDEINDSYDMVEEDLDEMEDSFIDDRSQLTQRSPLTAMKEKNRDTSVNMMDIYRISLLTPHRQQLRFRTPAFQRHTNRYKMVYDKLPSAHDTSTTSTSATDGDEDHDTELEDECGADSSFASPEQSQIVVRRKRFGKRRVLAESFCASPDAVDPERSTTGSEYKPENTKSILANDCRKSISEDAIFKRPGNTAPLNVNRREEGIGNVNAGYLRENENMDDILAVLNDCDDESLMMEMNALENNTTLAAGSKLRLESNMNRELNKSKCDPNRTENWKSNIGQSSCRRSAAECSVNSRQERSRIGNLGQTGTEKCETISQASNCSGRTSVKRNLTSTSTCLKNKSETEISLAKLPDRKKTPNVGATEPGSRFNSKENNVRRELSTGKTTFQPQNMRNSKVLNQPITVSPLFPPLSYITSSNDSSSRNDSSSLQRTVGQASEQSKCDTSKVVSEHTDSATKSSPASTAAQRDKNKLTILVGSKEVSNCQVVSFLRRKHNIKAVVSQITGCDYIVSTRMAVERKFVSDISCQANFHKLIARVRELCDLYDRPCIVIERDRVKNGETKVTCEVRSKYFNRILALLAQTRIKVLFTENQEGTSDILASLAQIEEKKNYAIVYPLPLSKEKEKMVKFLTSIPRTSYISAISLCYHNKTLQEIITSSPEDLAKKVKTLSLKRAKDIIGFLQHGFQADMVKTST